MITGIFNSQAKLGVLIFLGTIAVIASVLAFEHLGGYIPCALCLKQRIPYYYGIPVAFIAMLAANLKWSPLFTRILFVATGLLVLWSLALAAYHSGVEWAWWAGPSECAATDSGGGVTSSADNLLSQLQFSKPPSCNEAAGRFLGLSFAGWNVIVSAIIAIMAFRAAFLSRK